MPLWCLVQLTISIHKTLFFYQMEIYSLKTGEQYFEQSEYNLSFW